MLAKTFDIIAEVYAREVLDSRGNPTVEQLNQERLDAH